jgi:DNA-binding NarL/FixJ family response regulator
MIKILPYCTQPLLAVGFRCIMDGLPEFQLIECCSTTDMLMDQARVWRPELLLVDVSPGVTLDFLQELAAVSGGSIVLWSEGTSPEFLAQALSAGVRGVLPKDKPAEAYYQCIREVSSGKQWVDSEMVSDLICRRQVHLTPRERQLIGLVVQGCRNKEIAYALGISEGTVKVYLSRLFPKVGATDRLSLALIGLRNVQANSRHSVKRTTPPPDDRPVPFRIPQFLSTGLAAA